MKHLFFYSLFTVLALLTSCQEYDLGYTPEQIGYNITFRKDFGDYDMANDFNMAQRGQVTVTPTACPEVSIYSKAATGWQLVAKYDDVTGTRDLGFDIPKGTKEILVANGSQTQKTTVGGSVSFSGTRAGQFDFEHDGTFATLNDGQKYSYLYYNKETAVEFENYLPEGRNNYGKLTEDFSMISTGEFIIYPTWFNCEKAVKLGIYYYKSDGSIEQQYIWGPHQYNQEIQALSSEGVWETVNTGIHYQCSHDDEDGTFKCDVHDTRKEFGITHSQISYTPHTPYSQTNKYRSKGIIVNLPIGTKFGFFERSLTQYRDKQRVVDADYKEEDFYSESVLNRKYYSEDSKAPNGVNNHIVKFATYFDESGDLLIASEDVDAFFKANSFCDEDFNDRIFKIYGAIPEILSNDAQSWILPFEDLGGSFDWDFNDVILKMEYVSGQKTAKITPIAAGGTLHSEVFFNDTDDESKVQDLGEIHVLLGAEPVGEDELYEPINASHRGTPGTVKTVNITDPATFSIANAQSGANSSANGTSTKSMVGAYIVTKGNHGLSTIAYNGMGKAPAMLVLPTIYENEELSYRWAWPIENQDIREAYNEPGHSFAEWVADHTKAQDWYKYPTRDIVEPSYFYTSNEKNLSIPEYNLGSFGTIISLPSKDVNGYYNFDARHLANAKSAIVTVLFNGVQDNALYAYDGSSLSEPLGVWSRLNYGGTITIIGNNSCGPGAGSTRIEGVYQVELSSTDLAAIISLGQWVISSGSGSQILGLSIDINSGEIGGVIDDVEWGGQEEEPGSSNDPANGSEPVLAPIR